MSQSRQPASGSSLPSRVERRVAEAGEALRRRHHARRPRRRAERTEAPAAPAKVLDRASLGSVFRELGDAHRRYRLRTGNSGTPELRAAARAFKAEPTLPALVTVAAFLDELGLLAW
jgi:hypothetical protein